MQVLKKHYGLFHFTSCVCIYLIVWFILLQQMDKMALLSESGDSVPFTFAYFCLLIVSIIILVAYFICFRFKKLREIKFGHFFHYPLRLFTLSLLFIIELPILFRKGAILWLGMFIIPFLFLCIFISFIVGISEDIKSKGKEI